MSCETQNVDVTFNDTTAQSLAFDDATALSLAFDDVVNQNIQCSKFEEAGANSAPEFAGVTSWDWSAKSLSALADSDPVDSWTDRHSGLAVAGSGSARPTKTTVAGVDAVEYDGANDQLSAAFSPDFSTGITVFAVAEHAVGLLYQGVVMMDRGSSSASDSTFEMYAGSRNTTTGFVSAIDRVSGIEFFSGGSFSNNARNMLTAIHGTTTSVTGLYKSRTRVDSTISSGDGLPEGPSPTRVFVGVGYNATPWTGYIHELVVYDGTLTSSQRDEVWDFLESEWGGPF